jgi:hypothetical protein
LVSGRGHELELDLFAEKSSGYQQKNGFVNKHRQITPIKNAVGNTASDNGRHGKEYQNAQFSTDAHPRLPPPSIAIT